MYICRKVFLCVFCVFISSASSEKTISNNALFNKVLQETDKRDNGICAKCIKNIVKNYFPRGVVLHLVSTVHDLDGIIKALNNDLHSSLLVRSFHQQQWFNRPDVYIFFITDIRSELNQIKNDKSWNPAIKTIVVALDVEGDEINKMFNVLLDFNIYNVICLVKTAAGSVNIYTYLPFQNNNCGRKFDNAVNIGDCEKFKGTKLFPDKPKNYKNCTLSVVAREIFPNVITSETAKRRNISVEGIEQYLLNQAAKAEGVSLTYTFTSDVEVGVILPNGTVTTGLLSYLQNGTADIVLGDLSLDLSRVNLFDYMTLAKYEDHFVLLSSEYKPYQIQEQFNATIWFLIFCLFSLTLTITTLLPEESPRVPRDWIKNMLVLYGYLLGQSSSSMFKQNRLKLLMIIWIWFSMFIGFIYVAAFNSVVIVRPKGEALVPMSLAELTRLSEEPCVDSSFIKYFATAYNFTLTNDKPQRPECQNMTSALTFVCNTKGMYTIVKEYDRDIVESSPGIELTSIPLNLPSAQVVAYTNKGFYLRDAFEIHLQRVYERGRQTRYVNRILKQLKKKKHAKQETELHYMRKYYIVLLCGYIVSFICFIIERIKITQK